MSENEFQITREEFQAINEKYREVKHNINNTLAVVMALSELAQRNPAHYEKLAKAVLQRGPDVVQQMQDFQALLGAKLKGDGAPPSEPPPTSGVF
jgi:two-component sensor histidine kinase